MLEISPSQRGPILRKLKCCWKGRRIGLIHEWRKCTCFSSSPASKPLFFFFCFLLLCSRKQQERSILVFTSLPLWVKVTSHPLTSPSLLSHPLDDNLLHLNPCKGPLLLHPLAPRPLDQETIKIKPKLGET